MNLLSYFTCLLSLCIWLVTTHCPYKPPWNECFHCPQGVCNKYGRETFPPVPKVRLNKQERINFEKATLQLYPGLFMTALELCVIGLENGEDLTWVYRHGLEPRSCGPLLGRRKRSRQGTPSTRSKCCNTFPRQRGLSTSKLTDVNGTMFEVIQLAHLQPPRFQYIPDVSQCKKQTCAGTCEKIYRPLSLLVVNPNLPFFPQTDFQLFNMAVHCICV